MNNSKNNQQPKLELPNARKIRRSCNRKKLADWFEEFVAPEIARLWDIEPTKLSAAFRDGFGG